MFDELSARSPITVIADGAQRRNLPMKTPVGCVYLTWKQIFRPCALGIIGLAIAVVLWAAGYKLSLYLRHATASSLPDAKLWIESCNASETTASRFKAKSHLVPGSQAFSVPMQRLPRFSSAVTRILPLCARDVACFGSLIPFRSPPPHRFGPA
jgi:hypothetical protein